MHIDASWPSSLMDVYQKLVALTTTAGRYVVLPALGGATLTFTVPLRPSLVTGYVRLDTINAIFFIVLEVLTDQIDISDKYSVMATARRSSSTMSAISA